MWMVSTSASARPGSSPPNFFPGCSGGGGEERAVTRCWLGHTLATQHYKYRGRGGAASVDLLSYKP